MTLVRTDRQPFFSKHSAEPFRHPNVSEMAKSKVYKGRIWTNRDDLGMMPERYTRGKETQRRCLFHNRCPRGGALRNRMTDLLIIFSTPVFYLQCLAYKPTSFSICIYLFSIGTRFKMTVSRYTLSALLDFYVHSPGSSTSPCRVAAGALPPLPPSTLPSPPQPLYTLSLCSRALGIRIWCQHQTFDF